MPKHDSLRYTTLSNVNQKQSNKDDGKAGDGSAELDGSDGNNFNTSNPHDERNNATRVGNSLSIDFDVITSVAITPNSHGHCNHTCAIVEFSTPK